MIFSCTFLGVWINFLLLALIIVVELIGGCIVVGVSIAGYVSDPVVSQCCCGVGFLACPANLLATIAFVLLLFDAFWVDRKVFWLVALVNLLPTAVCLPEELDLDLDLWLFAVTFLRSCLALGIAC